MTDAIETLVRRVPQWKDADDIHITVFAGGLTNKNYRVQIRQDVFVLRVSGTKTELLGIDREHEYEAHQAAAAAGIAPEVVHFIRPEGYLVSRFIAGDMMSAETLRQPDNIRQVAALLKNIHALPPIAPQFSPFRIVESYTEIAKRYNVVFPDRFDWMIEQMTAIETALLQQPFTPWVCHNDLLAENFLDDGKIWILDWEYAGMGDIYFDLANLAANLSFADADDLVLLEGYFGEVTPYQQARLNLMKIMSDFRESMWALVQIGISTLDFDFHAYADKNFTNLLRRMQDARVGQWLVEVKERV